MNTLQIQLDDTQRVALRELMRETGKSEQELMGEALERMFDQYDLVEWQSALQKLEGIWEAREDLPDFRQLRREWDRNLLGD